MVMDHAFQDRMREASQLASEAWALVESIGDPTLTVGLAIPVIFAMLERPSDCELCGCRKRSSTWPTVTRRKATSSSGLHWRSPSRRGLLPVIRWVIPDGATTCGTA